MSGLVFGSVCSGIEAASVAWHPLGWRAAFLSEIAPFPRAVLSHRFPGVPLRGDFTEIQAGDHEPIDVLVGGTPCQSFSVAGLRGGLADERGALALKYLQLAQRLRPRWVVWENVPGVLSADGGRAFGALLGGLAELGYGWAYRVLDAQYFGLAQRRARVFVVGCAGASWQRAAAVLLERSGLRGDPAPSRGAGEGAAGEAAPDARGGRAGRRRGYVPGAGEESDVSAALMARASGWDDHQTYALDAYNHKADPFTNATLSTNPKHLTNLVVRVADPSPDQLIEPFVGDVVYENGDMLDIRRPDGEIDCYPREWAVAFDLAQCTSPTHRRQPTDRAGALSGDVSHPLGAKDTGHGMLTEAGVRRLMPIECERLQGFPDNWTRVPYRGKPADQCPDGPRYAAIGNSMATNVMAWIGRRIASVDAMRGAA
jgi:DNA (cytosine-5)-methyltransferase 1